MQKKRIAAYEEGFACLGAHPLAGAGLRGAALAPARVVGHVVAGEGQPGRGGGVAPPRARAPVLLPLTALALAHRTHMLVDILVDKASFV